ncbi:MAG: hypothetical protein JWN33_89 [Candidatus Saccharibacteria bacterium]|nr:hypothetical protein [Candidatus Saccharibacteria bacterium]
MADKRTISRSIKELQRVKTWQLVVLLILACFLSATFLRLNNIGMVERRSAVQFADEGGDQDTIIKRLYELQRYVSSHMNTDMGRGIYLEQSYKRDVQAAYDKASNDQNPNGNIYKKAQEVCAPQYSRYSSAYLACTTGELQKYPAAQDLISSVALPRADSYLHAFASPLWSPDFAGWSVVLCGVILLVIVARLLSLLVLRALLHQHYRSV